MSYILIIKRDCPFCISAIDLLQSKELEHEVSDLQDSPDALESIRKVFRWSTVPMVLLREQKQSDTADTYELIGGFDDLKDHLERETSVG
jgi:glutaredoxin